MTGGLFLGQQFVLLSGTDGAKINVGLLKVLGGAKLVTKKTMSTKAQQPQESP
jgi:hypothetical protein